MPCDRAQPEPPQSPTPAGFTLSSTLPRPAAAAPPLAVVGAGRWGRILCEVLCALAGTSTAIHLVASRNAAATREWLAGRQAEGALTQLIVADSLDALLARDTVRIAVVARMSCEHYATARRLLDAGVHVLVEKPFVRRSAQARELIALAESRNLRLAVGYEFMYSRTLHHFRSVIAQQPGTIRAVNCIWRDVGGVTKWGIRKDPDPSMNVVGDVYPHVLSQLLLLFGDTPLAEPTVLSRDGCRRASIEACLGTAGVAVAIELDKNAAVAERSIAVHAHDGTVLALDFTREPGTITRNGETLPPDPETDAYAPSLTAEMAYFIAHSGNSKVNIPNQASTTLPIVEATEQAERALHARQLELLGGLLRAPLRSAPPQESIAILRQHMVGPLLARGVLDNPKDAAALDQWTERALRIAHVFSSEPWTTQTEILRRENLDKQTLLNLNAAMRDADIVQDLIIDRGLAQKYWQTILPLVRSGSIDAVLTDSYGFPVRIGIYAAISCMFHCSFCGREADARYAHSEVDNGNAVFDAIFDGMAADGRSTLSLGGGLEPLTNAKIDEVIYAAKQRGLRVPLVTNGYMLTAKFIDRHPGLFDLDVLRISLYGVDNQSYLDVTGRKDAFEPVKANAIAFLKERNRRESRVKFGFNFVVLINSTEQVMRLLDVIHEINAAVDNGPGVDFLTLREDFSVPEEAGLTTAEREMLVDIFARFEIRQKELCPQLAVDYGYALHPLSQGIVWKPLAMVKADGMYPKAYPQVSVAVDILGDVYLYRDAAFINRPGADRYIIGRVTATRSLEEVIRNYLDNTTGIVPLADDPALMDAFDHVVTKTIWQGLADNAAGIPFNLGPIRARMHDGAAQTAASSATRMNYWERLDDATPARG